MTNGHFFSPNTGFPPHNYDTVHFENIPDMPLPTNTWQYAIEHIPMYSQRISLKNHRNTYMNDQNDIIINHSGVPYIHKEMDHGPRKSFQDSVLQADSQVTLMIIRVAE